MTSSSVSFFKALAVLAQFPQSCKEHLDCPGLLPNHHLKEPHGQCLTSYARHGLHGHEMAQSSWDTSSEKHSSLAAVVELSQPARSALQLFHVETILEALEGDLC